MNIASLLAGNLIGTTLDGVADRFINNLTPSKTPKFLDTFKQFGTQDRLKIEDLDLNREEEARLMEMRSSAQQKGIKNLEVEINGNRYLMNTQDLSFVPIVS